MLMRTVIAAIAFALNAVPMAFAQTGSATELTAVGEIRIGADGQVLDYRPEGKLAPSVAAAVGKNVRTWRFEPILVKGAPATAKTSVHIRLQLDSVNDSDTVRITEVSFGEPQRFGTIKPPRYPDAARKIHAEAKVMLILRLDDKGKIANIQPFQTSLDARPNLDSDAEDLRRAFEQATLAATKSWHFRLTETVNGKPQGKTIMTLVVFTITDPGSKPGSKQSKAYRPGPVRPAPWAPTIRHGEGRDLSAMQEGDIRVLDSRFHLKDNVIGATL
jgi:hypothetical protein